MNTYLEPDVNSLEKLALETARIPWKMLQVFFASGHAIYVSVSLDLVKVAQHIANDDSDIIKDWMDAGKITTVNNDQARDWFDNDSQVWAVVVRPWVLIQDDAQEWSQQ